MALTVGGTCPSWGHAGVSSSRHVSRIKTARGMAHSGNKPAARNADSTDRGNRMGTRGGTEQGDHTGDKSMANTSARTGKLDLNALRMQGPKALRHRFSEADIAQLEAEDLTDPWIGTMLETAYRQNDPEEREIAGIRREPPCLASKSILSESLAKAEATPKERPNDYWARYTRLCALTGLAYQRQQNATTHSAAHRRAS